MGNAVAVMDVPDAPIGRINTSRVILGGIVAGLAINVSEFVLNMVILSADQATELARMNLPPIGGVAIPTFIVLGFIGGIATVWLYAAIRTRFGAGPSTAVIAGLAVWFFAYLYPGIALYVIGIHSARMMVISLTWALVQSVVAALVGAALYSEG